ncbi:hypothetical protein DEO72_LG10g1538 [Vigna unguiculata]|uniref:Uncharacterized protein n=1 Tax=Vigna unguiculata TaxID=3917 RepID=A0A4D6N8Z5_VIGUN|nr:hypothetical protein DEO72_LG10g1538 [Vigna unguiculata]
MRAKIRTHQLATRARFNVNLDVYGDRMLDIVEIERLREVDDATLVDNAIVVVSPSHVIQDDDANEGVEILICLCCLIPPTPRYV